jgi:hypothetical protein
MFLLDYLTMKLPFLMTFSFAIVFFVQLGSLIYSALCPTELYTTMEKVPLPSGSFPITFKICVTPGFNETALFEAGYDSLRDYNRGLNRFNNSIGGWAGHTLEGGILNATGKLHG